MYLIRKITFYENYKTIDDLQVIELENRAIEYVNTLNRNLGSEVVKYEYIELV